MPSPDHSSFDRFYDRDNFSFGDRPSEQLRRFIDESGLTGRALDLGAGDGRNTLFLARCGFDVTAVDSSPVGLQKLARFAERFGLARRIEIICSDVRAFNPPAEAFDLIVLVTLLDHLPGDDIPPLWQRLTASLRPDGALYVKVHTTDDPGCERTGGSANAIASELASHIRHYFRPNELLRLARDGYRVIRYEETREYDTSHGPPHHHAFARLIARKRS